MSVGIHWKRCEVAASNRIATAPALPRNDGEGENRIERAPADVAPKLASCVGRRSHSERTEVSVGIRWKRCEVAAFNRIATAPALPRNDGEGVEPEESLPANPRP